jgi:hypothetical protein
VEREKTEGKEEYNKFNTSFKTIHDINDIKIKVEEGVVKDPMKRFNLEKYRVKISSYS